MKNSRRSSIIAILISYLLLMESKAFAVEASTADKNSCPFTQSSGTFQSVKDQMTQFSFQVLEQGSQAKNTLCQNYMNTLNTARTTYTSILRGKSLAATVATPPTATTALSQQEIAGINAQIQMSDAMQGLLGSGCQVDNQQALGAAALNIIDSVAGTITLAGLVDPRLLLVGVSMSAVSRLGVTLANWMLPRKETARDRLQDDLKNSAFLDRLCIFRSLAYKVDELNPTPKDLATQRRKTTYRFEQTELELYDQAHFRCLLNMEAAQSSYQKLSAELQEILALAQSKSDAEKCANYKYSLETEGKTTGRYRISHLFDLVWRIGCEDIGLPGESDASSKEPSYPSQRIADYCRNWRSLVDTTNQVDCFGKDQKAIQAFNSTAGYLFDQAAIVGEDALREIREADSDIYKMYRQLKDQRDLLEAQVNRLETLSSDQSDGIVQIESMLTNLGNIILGDGLHNYVEWNLGAIARNIDESTAKLKSIQEGSKQEKCSAGQYASQRIRQIEPRIHALKKVCEYLGSKGKPPKPPFIDPTRTFSSIIDLEESPLERICTKRNLETPSELPKLTKLTHENLKECAP